MAGPPLASFGSLGNVKRAGKTLRRARATPGQASSLEEVRKARGVVEAYRSAHAVPLNAAYMGLRSCLRAEGFDLDVSRRLKRLPTIEDKLRRLPWLDLSSMQDIGGCRAVLDTQEQVQRVVERFCANSLRRNQKSDTIKDYVVSPKPSGYRAVHIYTRYHNRRIEMQLRTRDQDSWAKLVEHLTNTTGIDFKTAKGQPRSTNCSGTGGDPLEARARPAVRRGPHEYSHQAGYDCIRRPCNKVSSSVIREGHDGKAHDH